MKKILFFVLIGFALSNCSKENDPKSVEIRLSNVSQYNFENIVVNTSTGNVSFGDLNAGQKSGYKTFDMAYSYAFVELEIEGETFTLQPIDYVGEEPLDHGFYTYQIGADDSQDQYTRLSFTLIEN